MRHIGVDRRVQQGRFTEDARTVSMGSTHQACLSSGKHRFTVPQKHDCDPDQFVTDVVVA